MIILECWMTVGRGWEVHLLQSLEKKRINILCMILDEMNKYIMYAPDWWNIENITMVFLDILPSYGCDTEILP